MSQAARREEVLKRCRRGARRPSALVVLVIVVALPQALLLYGAFVDQAAFRWLQVGATIGLAVAAGALTLVTFTLIRSQRGVAGPSRSAIVSMALVLLTPAAALAALAVALARVAPAVAATMFAVVLATILLLRSFVRVRFRRRTLNDNATHRLRAGLWVGIAVALAMESPSALAAFVVLDFAAFLTGQFSWRDRLGRLPTQEQHRLNLLGTCEPGGG